jgi:hypothetical protein
MLDDLPQSETNAFDQEISPVHFHALGGPFYCLEIERLTSCDSARRVRL